MCRRSLIFAVSALVLGTYSSGWECQHEGPGPSNMLHGYSARAKSVLFLARLKAGEDGARAVSVDHLLQAIVLEDQGGEKMARIDVGNAAVGTIRGRSSEDRAGKFFSPGLASLLLAQFEGLSLHSGAVPKSQDMPISADLVGTLALALDIKCDLHAEMVEPLHLLAAALGQQSNSAVRVFLDSGVTKEKVLDAIRQKQ